MYGGANISKMAASPLNGKKDKVVIITWFSTHPTSPHKQNFKKLNLCQQIIRSNNSITLIILWISFFQIK